MLSSLPPRTRDVMMNRLENQEINDRVSIGRVDKIKNPNHRYLSPSVKDRQKATHKALDLQYETKKPNYIFGMNDSSSNEFQTWNKSKIGNTIKDDPTVTSWSLSDASNNDRTHVSTSSSQSHSSNENRSSVGSRRRPPRPLSPKPPEGNRKSLPPRNEGCSISGNIRESESDIHRVGYIPIQTMNDKSRKLSFPPRNEGSRTQRALDEGSHASVSTIPLSDTRKLPTRKSGGSGDLSISEEGGTHLIPSKGLNTRTMPPRNESLVNSYDSEDETRRRIRSMRPVRKDSISKDQSPKPVERSDILSSPVVVVSKKATTIRDQKESHSQLKPLSHSHPRKNQIDEEEELDMKDIQDYREKNNRISSRNEQHYASDSHLFASIVRKQSYTGLNDRLHASTSQMGEIKHQPKKVQSTINPQSRTDSPTRQKTSSESEIANPMFLFKLSQSLQKFTGPEKITSRYLAKLSETLEMPVAYSCQNGLELVTSEGLVLVSDLLKLDA